MFAIKKKCKCRICGTESIFELYRVKEMMRGKEEFFFYFWCTECDCLQIEKIPENLGDYYYSDYYSYQKPLIQKGRKQERLKDIAILDVGCGAGQWLCEMANQGYSNLWGCDPYLLEDLHYENGVTIKKCSIHEMHQKFDQIRFHHSFEHMTDPYEVFQKIFHLLKDGGVCEITIPVVPNLAFDLFQENWYQLDAPRHIFLHSSKSITYLAEKAKLNLTQTKYESNNGQFFHSMLYQKGIPFEQHDLEVYNKYFTNIVVDFCNRLTNQVNKEQRGDTAVFYFTKKSEIEVLQNQEYEENQEHSNASKEELLILMEEAIHYLIQQREKKQLDKAAFLLDDLLDASKTLYAEIVRSKKD